MTVGLLAGGVPEPAQAASTTRTQTFGYSGAVEDFVVPDGVTLLTVTIRGGEGGNGGSDQTAAPPLGTYTGVVSGTLSVAPGQRLRIAVGSGGATGRNQVSNGTASAAGGSNPLDGYDGGAGGRTGVRGTSGQGGAGGAASVLIVGDAHVVAAGGGGNGGSGQYASTRGRNADGTFVARSESSTSGQTGRHATDACAAATCSNDDGGGSGGGGGGAQGGAAGAIEFGAGTSNEWFGYGGAVGANSDGGFTTFTTGYEYAASNRAAGSLVISYDTGLPSAPTAVQATAGDGGAEIVWTTPALTGSSPITGYLVRYTTDGGTTWSAPVLVAGQGTLTTISGLGNGADHRFQVAAQNEAGTGAYSEASAAVRPRGVPAAPTIASVTSRDAALDVIVSSPVGTVTGYEYRVDGGSWLPTESDTMPLIVRGLTNGRSYSVEVRALNESGAGPASAPASGTPAAVPGAPRVESISVGADRITLTLEAGYSGGRSVTSYEVHVDGDWRRFLPSDPVVLTGLTRGTTYPLRVRTISGDVQSAETTLSVTTADVPGAPTLQATPGDSAATVSVTLGSDGGAVISGLEYSTDGATWTAAGTSGPLLIAGLTNGVLTTVRVRAVNAHGAGPNASVAVTPRTVPSAPHLIGGSIAGGAGTLTVTFDPSDTDGGSAILRYEYSTDGGVTWRTRDDGRAGADAIIVTARSDDGAALIDGVTYAVQVRAVNAAGAGPASAVAPGVPVSKAAAPTITAVQSRPGALAVAFTPGSNGGAAVDRYEYSIDDGATWQTTGGLSSEFVITGLANGTSVAVRVRAVTSAGDGTASEPVTGTPATVPEAPELTSVARGDGRLDVTVSPGGDGGSAVQRWEYTTDGGATWATAVVHDAGGPVLRISAPSSDPATAMDNGRAYAIRVRAVNLVGAGLSSASAYAAPATTPPAPALTLTGETGRSPPWSPSRATGVGR